MARVITICREATNDCRAKSFVKPTNALSSHSLQANAASVPDIDLAEEICQSHRETVSNMEAGINYKLHNVLTPGIT